MRVRRLLKGMFIIGCLTVALESYAITEHNTLVNYVSLGEFSKDSARIILKKMPPLDTMKARHTLVLYKINYKTPAPNGMLTIASGLVAMPLNPTEKTGIVSYQHGTRFERNDVPSRNNEKDYVYLATFGSSAGYMIVMPDYLGFGDNELMIHPYVQAETLASSSVNMVVAAKELAKLLNYPVSDKLFLGGYSEGGFATTVLFEMLAKEYPNLPVSAVSAGSAPYDWQETMHFIMLNPGPRATAYLAFFFYALQTYKHYWTGIDEIFVAPYNTLIPVLLDGYHTTQEVLQALPLNPKLIFQPNFISGILNDTDRNFDLLKMDFNHYQFTPTAPFLLVGTKGDQDVPYHGAEIAYQVLSHQNDFVSIQSVSDSLDHVQALPFVLKEQVEFFNHYNN